jgi:hypothetical protein
MATILPFTGNACPVRPCAQKFAVLENPSGDEVARSGTVILVQDATVYSDISGQQHVVHLARSRQLLEWCHAVVARIVEDKGYVVSDRSVLSIGLSGEPGASVRVFDGIDVQNPDWASVDSMELRSTPVELTAAGFDEQSVAAISDLHRSLSPLRDAAPTQGQHNPGVKALNLAPGSILLVTQSVGVQFPTWKKWVEGIVIFSFGALGWESDNTRHLMAIVEPGGEVIWAGSLISSGGGHDDYPELQKDLEALFSDLPDHQ